MSAPEPKKVPSCEACNDDGEVNCQECCDHDYDPDEGMMCINCDAEYPY